MKQCANTFKSDSHLPPLMYYHLVHAEIWLAIHHLVFLTKHLDHPE